MVSAETHERVARTEQAPPTAGVPGQGREVYAGLRSRKACRYFTSAHGAQCHDAPMAPQTRNQVVFDWLDTNP